VIQDFFAKWGLKSAAVALGALLVFGMGYFQGKTSCARAQSKELAKAVREARKEGADNAKLGEKITADALTREARLQHALEEALGKLAESDGCPMSDEYLDDLWRLHDAAGGEK